MAKYYGPCKWPMRGLACKNVLAIVGLLERPVRSVGQLGLISMETLFTPWNNASQSSKCYVHEMGPCSRLMKQPTMPLEGQCESLVQRLHTCNGPMQGCASRQQYIILAHAIVAYSCLPCP